MRIGIDLSVLPKSASKLTGVSNYAFLLAKYLLELKSSDEFILFYKNESELTEELADLGGELKKLPNENRLFFVPHLKRSHLMEKQNLDLLHGPAYTTPIFYRGRTVISVHDLAIYKHPEWFPEGQIFSKKYLVPRSIKKADQIIVPSESTKKDLMKIFGVGEEKIAVIPLGVEKEFIRRTNIGERISSQSPNSEIRTSNYILCVATLEPRKNLVRLIEAYEILPAEVQNKYKLLIAGGKGWKYQEVLDKFALLKQGLRENVKFLGSVSKSELIELYHEASLFVFIPLYEGFGLPVLEAMASGLPIVTSNNSSIPEFATGSSVLVDPTNVREISKEIEHLLRDKVFTKELRSNAHQQASKYSWAETANSTLVVYHTKKG